MRKHIIILGCFVLLLTAFVGCSHNATPDNAETEEYSTVESGDVVEVSTDTSVTEDNVTSIPSTATTIQSFGPTTDVSDSEEFPEYEFEFGEPSFENLDGGMD